MMSCGTRVGMWPLGGVDMGPVHSKGLILKSRGLAGMLRQIVSDFYFKNACGVDLAAPCDDPWLLLRILALGSCLHLCG